MNTIEKIIKSGHMIADKIKKAGSVADINALSKEIEEYGNLVDEKFGTPGVDGERESGLSMMLYIAAEEKARQLEHYPGENEAGNKDTADFETMLDSKIWVEKIRKQN